MDSTTVLKVTIPSDSIFNQDGSLRQPKSVQFWSSVDAWLQPINLNFDSDTRKWSMTLHIDLPVSSSYSCYYKFLIDETHWFLSDDKSTVHVHKAVPNTKLPVSKMEICAGGIGKEYRNEMESAIRAFNPIYRDAMTVDATTPPKANPYRPSLPVIRSVGTRAYIASSDRRTRFANDYAEELKNLHHYFIRDSPAEGITVYTLSRLTLRESRIPTEFEDAKVHYIYDDTYPYYDKSVKEWNRAILNSLRPMNKAQRQLISSTKILEEFKDLYAKALPRKGDWLIGIVNRVDSSETLREGGVLVITCADWEEAARVSLILPDEYLGRSVYKLRDHVVYTAFSPAATKDITCHPKLYQGINIGSKGAGMSTGPILRSTDGRLFMLLCGHAVNEGEDVYAPSPGNWFALREKIENNLQLDNLQLDENRNISNLEQLATSLSDSIQILVDIETINFANDSSTDTTPRVPVTALSLGKVIHRSNTTDIDWALVELNENGISKLPEPKNSFPSPFPSRLKEFPRSITQITHPIRPHNFKKDSGVLHKVGWASGLTSGIVYPDLERKRGVATMQVLPIYNKNAEPYKRLGIKTFTTGGDSSASVFHIVPDIESSQEDIKVLPRTSVAERLGSTEPAIKDETQIDRNSEAASESKHIRGMKQDSEMDVKHRDPGVASSLEGGEKATSGEKSDSNEDHQTASETEEDKTSSGGEEVATDLAAMDIAGGLLGGLGSGGDSISILKLEGGTSDTNPHTSTTTKITASLLGICSELWLAMNVSYVERMDKIVEAIKERDPSIDLDLA